MHSYFAEAMTQMHARHLAELFNKEVRKKRLQLEAIVGNPKLSLAQCLLVYTFATHGVCKLSGLTRTHVWLQRMVPATILVLVECGNKLINLGPLLEGRLSLLNFALALQGPSTLRLSPSPY